MKLLHYLSKSENSLAIIFSLAVLSLALPNGVPFFGQLVILLTAIKLFSGVYKVRINTGFYLLLASVGFYFLGLLWSNGSIYNLNMDDLKNIFNYSLIWLLLSDLQKEDYKTLLNNFGKYISVSTFFVVLLSFYKFYAVTNFIIIDWLMPNDGIYRSGTSLSPDYNMFTYAIFCGIIMSAYMLTKSNKTSHSLFFTISIISGMLSVILAGSRRGWIVLIILLVVFSFNYLSQFLSTKKGKNTLRISFVTVVFLLPLGMLLGQYSDDIDLESQFRNLKLRFFTLTSSDSSFSDRSVRWEYAGNMINDSSVHQVVLGSGFDYLPIYADKFAPEFEEDYPHNPIISTFLYSGIIGTLVVLLLLAYAQLKAIIHRHLLSNYFLLLFLMSWIYILFSSNSIFSNKIFFIMILVSISIPRKQGTQTEV